jgi:hypothetical protein
MYELKGDSSFRAFAQRWTAGLEAQQFNTRTHDVGFIIFCSYGNAHRLTPEEQNKQVLLQAAASLSTRFNPIVGCIRSWDGTDWSYPVIIDNMMNLELLFWATKNGGPPTLRDMAVSHALKTMQNHFRQDGSTYHVVSYDTLTGSVVAKQTHQGYSDESVWARGQAWALYGFTMAYRETNDERFLVTAERAADYFISHLPPDFIPYWDFLAPNIPDAERDVSAAAIACSGLLELSVVAKDSSAKGGYLQAAKNILGALCVPPYLSEGTGSMALLNHGVGNWPAGSEIDVSLIYGDYYFLEALHRYAVITAPVIMGVTVTTNPAGLMVSIDGTSYTAPQTFNWVVGSQHTLSVSSPQTSSEARRVFSHWSDGEAQTHTVTVSALDVSDTAFFSTQYRLTTAVSPPSGGSVNLSPASPDGYYGAGSSVQMNAVPAIDYVFTGWSGDVAGSANPDTVVMSSSKTVSATFAMTNGVGIEALEIPRIFSLFHNYPNPFNPSTTIRYGLPRKSFVTLTVFNTLGQRVVVPQNGEQEAGYHETTLDGTGLSSGVYLYRLQAGSFTDTKSLLLIR